MIWAILKFLDSTIFGAFLKKAIRLFASIDETVVTIIPKCSTPQLLIFSGLFVKNKSNNIRVLAVTRVSSEIICVSWNKFVISRSRFVWWSFTLGRRSQLRSPIRIISLSSPSIFWIRFWISSNISSSLAFGALSLIDFYTNRDSIFSGINSFQSFTFKWSLL